MKRAMRELSDSNAIAERGLDSTGCPEDTGDADSQDSHSPFVSRTPAAMARKVKEALERSASMPPVLRLSKWAEGDTIKIESGSEGRHSPDTDSGEREAMVQMGTAQYQEDQVIAPHYSNIVQSVQPYIFLHLLTRKEYQQGGSKKIAQAILRLHDLGVSAGSGTVNDKPL